MHFDDQLQKTRIGVFFGGKSVEREASFSSGRTVCDHLDSFAYHVVPIYQTESGTLHILPWKFLHRGKTLDFESKLHNESQKIAWDDLSKYIDFAYIAMHGRFGEDGILQGALTLLNITFLGSGIFSSALGMDKIAHNFWLREHGIFVPKGVVFKAYEIKQKIVLTSLVEQRLLKKNIKLPVIVKPSLEGSSLGVCVVYDLGMLTRAIFKASTAYNKSMQSVIVEEKMTGMEFTCILLEDKKTSKEEAIPLWNPLSITEVVPDKNADFYDYQQKYMPGCAQKITPARCSKKIQNKIYKVCKKVTQILGFRTLSRIDGFVSTEGKIVIIDSNSLSGMSPSTFLFHQAAEIGIGHTQLISHLISNHLYLKSNLSKINQVTMKKKVIVLLGGDSHEREISLESGRNVCYKLSSGKYEVIPIFVNEKRHLFKLSPRLLIQNSTAEIASQVSLKDQIKWADLPNMGDFVFIALHGGCGENGATQGMLEMLSLPYNGSGVFASSLSMDKYRTTQWLKAAGLTTPFSVLFTRTEWERLLNTGMLFDDIVLKFNKKLTYPFIVKPHNDGCSTFVTIATDFISLEKAITNFFETSKNNIVMLEEYIEGIELTVGVLGNDVIKVFPASAPVSQKKILSIQEKFLPGAGENQTPAPLSELAAKMVKEVIAQAYNTVQCRGYARIDCFYQDKKVSPTGKDRVVILEINTLPGLTPATCFFHQAAEVGMKPIELLEKIIDLGFESHKKVSSQELLSSSSSYAPLER